LWRNTSRILNVQIGDLERIFLNEIAARLDIVPHQSFEDVAGSIRLGHTHLQQGAHILVEGRFPKLVRVHFTQTLIALGRHTFASDLEHSLEERQRARDDEFRILGHQR